ncbi:MAG: hypothetical protein JXR12_01505 [Neptunomonas phycophila]|uniref:T4 family baseplate hub assembly chaperone n=1 Tax=Neptunomonas phycophila TaxID=1572645 RepID=UPI003B8EA0AE
MTDMNNVNPLMMTQARIPGETFALPSGGLFYTNGELDSTVQNGEVHVFPMTAYDEIVIKTPDLLFNGKAIEQIFSRCIPAIKKPMEMLVKDVDYLLIALRLVSFGPQVTVVHKHDCETANEQKYEVSIQEFVHQVKRIDPAVITSEYTVTLDSGYSILLSPMRYKTVVEMMTDIDTDKPFTPEETHERNAGHLSSLIVSVTTPPVEGGQTVTVTDQAQIVEWVSQLTILDMKRLQDAIDGQRNWGTDTHYNVQCKDCNSPVRINVPLNPIHFFTWS